MYGVKVVLNNIWYVANPRKLARNLVSWKSQRDNLRFALFMGLMNGVYKFVLCVLRRFLKSDKWAAPIAGFLAGLCCYVDDKDRRKFFMIVLLARLSDTVYSMGESRGLC